MEVCKKLITFLIVILVFITLNGFLFHKKPVMNEEKNSEAETVIKTEAERETETEADQVELHFIDDNKKYVGVYATDPYELDIFEDSLTLLGWFDSFDSPSTAKIKMCLEEHQYIAFITLQPKDMELREIADGKYDDQIISYLKMLSEGDRIYTELFVRFAHEMEMRPTYGKNWYSWQGYDDEGYVSAWRHVVQLSKQYAPNVKWVWSPNRADEYTVNYYPGDDYVDYVGLTLNNFYDSYETFQEFYEEKGGREFLEAYNKPIIFGEVAIHSLNEEQKNIYLASVFDYIKNYEKAVGVVFFNKNVESDRQYKFSNNETLLRTFIENAEDLKNYEKEE